MEFFITKYKELLGINMTIETREVTTEYQTVAANDTALHKVMALKYYKEGWMTVMYSNFDPNPEGLLGYALAPTELDTGLDVKEWYSILGIHSLGPTNTTAHHEIGHMLGNISKKIPIACRMQDQYL